ncbi:MAG: nucleotidyltransferase family protein [Firmicutes bacterium]|nr:nucleotidyltransferase family protein [Bacillota bacterium]
MKIDAVILAGGGIEESLKEISGAKSKGYIEIAGKMMIERAIDVLRDSSGIGRVVIAAEPEYMPQSVRDKADFVVQPGSSILASLESGIRGLKGGSDVVLVIPCDLPFLTVESVNDFLDQYRKNPSDIAYAFLSRKNSESKYPDLEHTYVKLKDGEFCGTGFIIIKPEMIDKCSEFMGKLTKNRKNPIALASIFGLSFILKFLTRTLTVRDLEEKVSKISGMSARGIETRHAEAGFNIDKASHYHEALRAVKGGSF